MKKETFRWLNEKEHLNVLLDTYAKSINILQPVATIYHAKYDGLVRFYNKLAREIPWIFKDSLKDANERSTPHSILWFFYLCEQMAKMFKFELKELKEHKAKCVI